VLVELCFRVEAVGDDDHPIAALHKSRGSSVCLDRARAGRTFDHVGLEPVAVVDVEHVDQLVWKQVCRLHQLHVDRDAAGVVQVAIGHGRAVNLGLEHLSLHRR
jgi:hypothetical protein